MLNVVSRTSFKHFAPTILVLKSLYQLDISTKFLGSKNGNTKLDDCQDKILQLIVGTIEEHLWKEENTSSYIRQNRIFFNNTLSSWIIKKTVLTLYLIWDRMIFFTESSAYSFLHLG